MKRSYAVATGIAALALIPALALTACSSSGGRQDTGSDSSGSGAVADTPKITIAMITHAPAGDTFWDTIRKGAEAAAAKDNVDFTYSGDEDGGRQAQLVQQAIDQKVDGIAVTLAKPDALSDVVKKAVDAGIPVTVLNAGEAQYKDLGTIGYYGQEDEAAGVAVGERLAGEGITHPICIIQAQGAVNLESRCAGVKSKVPGTEVLYVTGTDMTQVSSTVTAKMQSTPDADAYIGLGAPITLAVVDAKKSTGISAEIASFDLNSDLTDAIKAGDVSFTVDQQPYVQGYLSVDALWLQSVGGFTIGGGGPVYTGPTFVDADNVDTVATYAADGLR
ncbi:substrate-binding domain-containing protein [Microbacteriaceae bacterium VKM Ac-2855]|nr:substrate-binding domain-containing protein [Microbacteriaceae bacterium VKM Ac-2855]